MSFLLPKALTSYFLVTILVGAFTVSVLPVKAAADDQNSTEKVINVKFADTPLTECVSQILHLAGTSAQISFKTKKNMPVTKELSGRWDAILKAILEENGLMLTKIDGEYYIIDNPSQATLSFTGQQANDKIATTSAPAGCAEDNLVTFGYKFSSGANPYALVGKCVKLHNFKPIQYFGATKALASWSYRDGSGIVYVEDQSGKMLLNNARSITAVSVGVYEYGSVVGAKKIVPHLIIH